MTFKQKIIRYIDGHRVTLIAALCLFGLGIAQSHQAVRKRSRKVQDDRVHLVHSDQLSYDIYGPNPEAQIVKGWYISVIPALSCFAIALTIIRNPIHSELSDMFGFIKATHCR